MSGAAPPRQGLGRSALLSLVSPEWRKAGRLVEIEAAGASMAPLIREGDRLGLRMTDDRALRAGDVFAFEREGAVVVHRLVAKRREGAGWRLCEKGDGCSSWSWVEGGAVIGRVETIHRAGRCLDLRQRPWRWAGSAGARLWSAGIAAAEWSRSAGRLLWGPRPAPPALSAPAGGLLRIARAAHCAVLRVAGAWGWR